MRVKKNAPESSCGAACKHGMSAASPEAGCASKPETTEEKEACVELGEALGIDKDKIAEVCGDEPIPAVL